MKSFLLSLLLVPVLALADPPMQMHRTQAATKDEASGWYLAESTKGAFSVLVPVPFNDFSLSQDNADGSKLVVHVVGTKNAEGIKFTATEAAANPKKPEVDLKSFPEGFNQNGSKVADVDHADFGGFPAVTFTARSPLSAAFVRCVKTPSKLYLLILESPLDQEKKAESLKGTFLGSLKIKAAVPAEEKASK